MLLVIDAGNTNTVFAVFEGEELRGQWRISTDARRTADEYAVWLLRLMEMQAISPAMIRGAIAASVVPAVLFDLKNLCRQYFNQELSVVGETIDPGIPVRLPRAGEVGADRLVNGFAAWSRWRCPLIIVDFGTATTFDVVSGEGEYIGGVIAPGVNLSLDTLQRAAARLPNVSITAPAAVIGTDTVSAMQSGIYFGYVGLIEGIAARIRAEYAEKSPQNAKTPMKVIATGGLASLYARAATVIEHLEPDLTLTGLRDIYRLRR